MNIFYWKAIGINIPQYWKTFFKFTVPVAFMTGMIAFFTNSVHFNWIKLLCSGAIYFIIYLMYCYFCMNDFEKGIFLSIKNKVFRRKKI